MRRLCLGMVIPLTLTLAVAFTLALASACTSPMSPGPPSLAGTWSEQFGVPGPSLVLTLDASGNGNGTYAIEAGRSGVVQVRGSEANATVTLVLQYDYGLSQTFVGALSDSTHLRGTFSNQTGTVVFVRQ